MFNLSFCTCSLSNVPSLPICLVDTICQFYSNWQRQKSTRVAAHKEAQQHPLEAVLIHWLWFKGVPVTSKLRSLKYTQRVLIKGLMAWRAKKSYQSPQGRLALGNEKHTVACPCTLTLHGALLKSTQAHFVLQETGGDSVCREPLKMDRWQCTRTIGDGG